MEALFPEDPEVAQEWGTKVTLFKLEHLDCKRLFLLEVSFLLTRHRSIIALGCQAILRLLPDGKIENIGGFSQLPGVMQSYVRIFFKNKEKKCKFQPSLDSITTACSLMAPATVE